MAELLADLAWPLIPATAFWLIFHEPTISAIWCVVGIVARWHRRRSRQKPTDSDRDSEPD
jgi:hypothetical protein